MLILDIKLDIIHVQEVADGDSTSDPCPPDDVAEGVQANAEQL